MVPSFITQIRLALEHVNDPHWLGENSPLAAPYFLSHHMTPNIMTAVERGHLLQQLLHTAAAHLWGGPLPVTKKMLTEAAFAERELLGTTKSPRYGYLLLDLFYFRRYFLLKQFPTTKVKEILEFVTSSRTRFYSHLKKTVAQVAERLLRLVNPTFRLEAPRLRQRPIGRQDVVAQCLAVLEQGKSAALSGGGGIGKTTVATAVCQAWQQAAQTAHSTRAIFWHTIRPGLTDTLDSILFSLSYFLHQQGASSLWHQMLASSGQVLDRNLVLGLLRDDLQTMQQNSCRLLVCIDELDQLGRFNQRSEAQAATVELIESLEGELPLLLLGQHIPLDTAHHFRLTGLTTANIGQLFQQEGLVPDAARQRHLQQQTQGNPRLLEIYLALLKSGDSIFEAGYRLRRTPALPSLLERLWKRLSVAEQGLLGQLAVFQQPAPADAWPTDLQQQLAARLLLQQDAQGGISLLPLFRQVLLDLLPAEQRETYHARAAAIWAERGSYTASAYHWWQAGEPETAVSLWYPQRQLEIERGQASIAFTIFNQISLRRLSAPAQRQLKELRNQLLLLQGDATAVLAEAEPPLAWPAEDEAAQQGKAAVLQQEAHAAHLLSDTETALEKYEAVLVTLGQLTSQKLDVHYRRSTLYLADGNQAAALSEVERAKCEAARLDGLIQSRLGNYRQASQKLNDALALAPDQATAAKIRRLLVINESHAGQLAQARAHAEQAISYYQQIGDQLSVTSIQANLAAAYINQQDFVSAIPLSEKALAFFKKINSGTWIASISANLAEAYFETGRVAEAKTAAFTVLRLEEPHAHPYALYTLGLVHEQEGEPANAQACFQRGIDIAQQNGDKFIEAYLQRVLGQLFVRRGDEEAAQDVWQTAVFLFTHMNLDHEVAATNVLLAEGQVESMQ